jgi:hypothetical protein
MWRHIQAICIAEIEFTSANKERLNSHVLYFDIPLAYSEIIFIYLVTDVYKRKLLFAYCVYRLPAFHGTLERSDVTARVVIIIATVGNGMHPVQPEEWYNWTVIFLRCVSQSIQKKKKDRKKPVSAMFGSYYLLTRKLSNQTAFKLD